MTPAEFDTRRRLLGLSMEETAEWCGANRVTVQRWIKNQSRISPSAIARLDELESRMNAAVEAAVAVARREKPDVVRLLRYRSQAAVDASPHAAGMPPGAHAILIGWKADALEAGGQAFTIEWGDGPHP